MRRASGRGLPGLVITIALHGGILAAVAVAGSKEEPPLIVSHDFVVAEMVKLGKPREKFWLPRIQQPARAEAPPQTLKVAEDPNAAAAPKEAPRPDDPKISKDLKRALDRARKLEALATPDEPDEGSATGSKLGTSNREIGDQYQAQVVGMLHQNYNFPAGINVDQINNPPEIAFHIGGDGTIADVHLTKPSGNSFVDDACVDAAKLTAKLPPPPAGVRGMRVQCEK
ncbi:MAG TPA: TonB family protein [Polyangia bacterium]|nr:TonB family protein [Polyangia bacterium]